MMKQTLKYLLGLVLFVGALGVLESFASETSTEKADIHAPVTGCITEQGTDYTFDVSDEMVTPSSSYRNFSFRENRVQQIFPRGISFVSRITTHQTARDHRSNYARIEEQQQALLPFIDPSLQYVFLLRRILI